MFIDVVYRGYLSKLLIEVVYRNYSKLFEVIEIIYRPGFDCKHIIVILLIRWLATNRVNLPGWKFVLPDEYY
jgi:hypothetical protein